MNSNNFSLDIKKELPMTSSDSMKICQPLHLSRRHGSVESRSSSTSPFSSTNSLGENSPAIHIRTSTQIDQSPYPQRSYGISEALLQAVEHHRNMGENSPTTHNRANTPIDTYSTPYPQKCYGISEALLQAVEYHWNTQQLHTPTRESNESFESSSLNSHPMESDDNLIRPFKKFRRETIESQSDSNSSDMNWCPINGKEDVTLYRPLNVYGRESIQSQSHKNYKTFRSKWLQEMNNSNGRQLIVNNPNMRRTSLGNQPGSSKDAAYYEKRQKNNLASKQSRDRRKMKQVDDSIRIAFLEKENMQLKTVLDRLKARIKTLNESAAQQ